MKYYFILIVKETNRLESKRIKFALGLDLNCAQPSISPIPLYQEILPPADIEQARSDITRINDVMKTISSIL
ncbi:unnamed protein product [Rotaria sp. Silwood1]|nr:unnamed protein product [Rotaria sp. Silwood1]CAF4863129.1 unnamed protein product [Rotaria sp. Silwood1]